MQDFDVIFILDDRTELIGKNNIEDNLHKFPKGTYGRAKIAALECSNQPDNGKKSQIKVYQDGRIDVNHNVEFESFDASDIM